MLFLDHLAKFSLLNAHLGAQEFKCNQTKTLCILNYLPPCLFKIIIQNTVTIFEMNVIQLPSKAQSKQTSLNHRLYKKDLQKP